MKKVLHIITKLELGGAQLNTLYTVEHLDRQHFQPFLFAGPGGMLDDEVLENQNIDLSFVDNMQRSIHPLRDYRAYRQLRRMIDELKPDIVQTHSSKAGILGRLAAHAEGVPVILHTIHGFGITAVKSGPMRWLVKRSETFAASRTTHFLPVSQENFETGRELGLLDESNATVLVEGVNLQQFRSARHRPEKRQEFGIPAEAPIIGCISCLKPQKNISALVDVARRVLEAEPDVYFMVLGDGEEREMIAEKIASLGIGDRFILAGWRRDVPELVRLWRASVLTSRWEGLPRAISESLSAEVPVVVTRAGGSAEAVRQGETGWVVEQGELERMAGHILTLVRDPELAARMGAQGPDSVLDWDIDGMVRQQEEIYRSLLKTNGN